MFAAKQHLNGHCFLQSVLQLHKVLLALWIYPKPIKTNNGEIHLGQTESQPHAAGQLPATCNPRLMFGAERTDSSYALSVRKHFAVWSFTGCQKGFLGPRFGKQWCNNLSPWHYLENQTHQNRYVKILGKQVSHGSLSKICWFSLFCLCCKRHGEQTAASTGPRVGQGALAEGWHWLVLHSLSPTLTNNVLMSQRGAQQRTDCKFHVFHGKWTVVCTVENLWLVWNNTSIRMKYGIKPLT